VCAPLLSHLLPAGVQSHCKNEGQQRKINEERALSTLRFSMLAFAEFAAWIQ
jgi:hypothetical protein